MMDNRTLEFFDIPIAGHYRIKKEGVTAFYKVSRNGCGHGEDHKTIVAARAHILAHAKAQLLEARKKAQEALDMAADTGTMLGNDPFNLGRFRSEDDAL